MKVVISNEAQSKKCLDLLFAKYYTKKRKVKEFAKCSFCGKMVDKSTLTPGGVFVDTGKVDMACKKCK
jgi:hypothetical protein